MSELLDKQVNAQKESLKFQAHKNCMMNMKEAKNDVHVCIWLLNGDLFEG